MHSGSVLTYAMAPSAHPALNSWEVAAIKATEITTSDGNTSTVGVEYRQQDPLIYPGLYSHSGFDMLDILFRVVARPNPQIDLGAVDSSCAMVLCDLSQPDAPIVYASDPFLELTGYSATEVIGRNCRFLQAPPGRSTVKPGCARSHVPKDLVTRMRKSVDSNIELQVEVLNFRKDGTPFTNILTIIPISWDDTGRHRYSVGFLCDKERIDG